MKRNLAIFLMGMTIATMVLGGCKDKENISKKDGKESESVEDKKTFTVGFDAEYPHMDIWMKMENIQDLIWNWQKQSVNWKVGSMVKNRSTGIRKIWN